jgi:hypothetical protein
VAEFIALLLAISCVSWTVTQEEIFREFREYCSNCHNRARRILVKKFFYLPTCHYCFSHYVTLFFLVITHYKLIYAGWRGYLVAFFALVFVANILMSLYAYLRQFLKLQTARAKTETVIAQIMEKKPYVK